MQSHINFKFSTKINHEKGNIPTNFQKIRKINRGIFRGVKILKNSSLKTESYMDFKFSGKIFYNKRNIPTDFLKKFEK